MRSAVPITRADWTPRGTRARCAQCRREARCCSRSPSVPPSFVLPQAVSYCFISDSLTPFARFRRAFGHTRTRLDPRNPDIPYQMDYLYASPTMAERLERCEVLAPPEWPSPSDHFPIMAKFRS